MSKDKKERKGQKSKAKMSGKKTKRFICVECGLQYTTNQHLQDHMLSHGDGNTFTCPHCPKVFGRPAYLTKHERSMHADQIPDADMLQARRQRYHCDRCPKRCATQQALQTHKLKHNNVRNFRCTACNFAFKTNANIQRHVRQQVCIRRREVDIEEMANDVPMPVQEVEEVNLEPQEPVEEAEQMEMDVVVGAPNEIYINNVGSAFFRQQEVDDEEMLLQAAGAPGDVWEQESDGNQQDEIGQTKEVASHEPPVMLCLENMDVGAHEEIAEQDIGDLENIELPDGIENILQLAGEEMILYLDDVAVDAPEQFFFQDEVVEVREAIIEDAAQAEDVQKPVNHQA